MSEGAAAPAASTAASTAAGAGASTGADAATAAGQKRPEAVPSFEAQAAEKRAKIAHLEATLANAEDAVEACEKTPLAQAVCAAACCMRVCIPWGSDASVWAGTDGDGVGDAGARDGDGGGVCGAPQSGDGCDGVCCLLPHTRTRRAVLTACACRAEGAKGAAEGDGDEDDEEEEEVAPPAPRRGVPGPGPNSRTVCPNCQRGVPCSRFTLHLDKCLAHPGTRRTKQGSRF